MVKCPYTLKCEVKINGVSSYHYNDCLDDALHLGSHRFLIDGNVFSLTRINHNDYYGYRYCRESLLCGVYGEENYGVYFCLCEALHFGPHLYDINGGMYELERGP